MVRGGAVWGKTDLTRGTLQARDIINKAEKQELVKCLGDIIEDRQVVALNGGTTNIEVAKFLVENYSRLTIITNNLAALRILRQRNTFQVILTGGIYSSEEDSLVGKQAEREIMMYNADVAVLAVNSISVEKGITDFRMEEGSIINAMIKCSKIAVIAADNSKFDRISCINVCNLDKISCIVTDSSTKEDVADRYKAAGVRVLKPQMGNFTDER